jgi:uncharacterized membrane protein
VYCDRNIVNLILVLRQLGVGAVVALVVAVGVRRHRNNNGIMKSYYEVVVVLVVVVVVVVFDDVAISLVTFHCR